MANVITGVMAMGVIFCYIAVLKTMQLNDKEIKIRTILFIVAFLSMVFTFAYFKG